MIILQINCILRRSISDHIFQWEREMHAMVSARHRIYRHSPNYGGKLRIDLNSDETRNMGKSAWYILTYPLSSGYNTLDLGFSISKCPGCANCGRIRVTFRVRKLPLSLEAWIQDRSTPQGQWKSDDGVCGWTHERQDKRQIRNSPIFRFIPLNLVYYILPIYLGNVKILWIFEVYFRAQRTGMILISALGCHLNIECWSEYSYAKTLGVYVRTFLLARIVRGIYFAFYFTRQRSAVDASRSCDSKALANWRRISVALNKGGIFIRRNPAFLKKDWARLLGHPRIFDHSRTFTRIFSSGQSRLGNSSLLKTIFRAIRDPHVVVVVIPAESLPH